MSTPTSLTSPEADAGLPSSPWKPKPQAAAYLSCTVRHLQRLVARGELPVYRRGRLVRFHVDDLDAYMAEGRSVA